jgi:hypothetical protein
MGRGQGRRCSRMRSVRFEADVVRGEVPLELEIVVDDLLEDVFLHRVGRIIEAAPADWYSSTVVVLPVLAVATVIACDLRNTGLGADRSCQHRVSMSRPKAAHRVGWLQAKSAFGQRLSKSVQLSPLWVLTRQAGGHWFEPSTAHLDKAPLRRGFSMHEHRVAGYLGTSVSTMSAHPRRRTRSTAFMGAHPPTRAGNRLRAIHRSQGLDGLTVVSSASSLATRQRGTDAVVTDRDRCCGERDALACEGRGESADRRAAR